MRISKLSLKEYEEKDSGVLEVGDVVYVVPRMGRKFLCEIDAVTKTIGKCDIGHYTYRFPRNIDIRFQSLPRDTWNTTEFTVYTKKETR